MSLEIVGALWRAAGDLGADHLVGLRRILAHQAAEVWRNKERGDQVFKDDV